MKIGVFDSGIGGLTVLKELYLRFPCHEYLYFGDTAHVPYGTKSVSQIRELSKNAARRMVREELDLLVVACNTASSLALEVMEREFRLTPVIGVVEAGTQAVLQSISDPNFENSILILGTRATIRSQIYSNLLNQHNPRLQVLEKACPLLVPMIEEGWRDHPILTQTIEEYTRPYLPYRPGVALLACTHYPWIKSQIEDCLRGWKIIDSAVAVSDLLERRFVDFKRNSGFLVPVRFYFSDPDAVDLAALHWVTPGVKIESF